jgi:hypothetical protein
MCNDLPSPSDWAVGSLAVGPKTKTIPNWELISGLILRCLNGKDQKILVPRMVD